MAGEKGWYGVDLDGTLAEYDGWKGITQIGAPIPAMQMRVIQWLKEGREVRIFTARVTDQNIVRHAKEEGMDADDTDTATRVAIGEWCKQHLGEILPITCVKDFGMIELWDDRCVQVEKNTGRTVIEQLAPELNRIQAAVTEILAEMGGKRVAKWDVVNDGFLALEDLRRRARGDFAAQEERKA